MLEELIAETKAKQAKQPISPEQYSRWRNSAVTKRLFEDLELAVIDSYQDYLSSSTDDVNELAILTGVRDGAAQMVERVIDWAPRGVEGPNDEG